MDAEMTELWRNAMLVSARTGVPAPALVEGYLRAVGEAGPDGVSQEAAQRVGEQLVQEMGPSAFVDQETLVARDAKIQELADRLGISLDRARDICDAIQQAALRSLTSS